MRYSAQREHVIQSLNSLLTYLYALSYLLFPSLSVFATRWFVQYGWLALQKEVVRHQLRWIFIPLAVLVLSVWTHTTTSPGVPIILDFIGRAAPPPLLVVLLLDLVIAFIELLSAAVFYEHVISFAQAMESVDRTKYTTPVISGPYRTRRIQLILDINASHLITLLWNPRSLFAKARSLRRTLSSTAREGIGNEGDGITTATSSRLAGLPLPFNLPSRSNRPARAENTIPGMFMRDW